MVKYFTLLSRFRFVQTRDTLWIFDYLFSLAVVLILCNQEIFFGYSNIFSLVVPLCKQRCSPCLLNDLFSLVTVLSVQEISLVVLSRLFPLIPVFYLNGCLS